jgi:hypothetical protein
MNRIRKRRKAQAIEYKGGACIWCGYNKSHAALCFHHRDSKEKDFTISSSNWTSIDVLKPELDKCDLLCMNCHNELHERIHEAGWAKREAELGMPVVTRGRTCRACGVKFEADGSKRCKACRRCRRLILGEVIEVMSTSANVDASADKLGVNVHSLWRFCKRHGVPYESNRAKQSHTWPSDTELARLVFEMPMTKLGKRLGVSSAAIGKRCRARQIAAPHRGYWTPNAKRGRDGRIVADAA